MTTPPAVTNEGNAHLSIEASSSHIALHVVAPVEVAPSVWQTQISVLAFQPNPISPLSTYDMAVKTSVTELALRSAGGPAELGVAVIDRNFAENVSPFPTLPAPNIRWTVRALGDDARTLLTRWRSMTAARQLSYDEVQSFAIEEMQAALQTVRLNQVSRTQIAPLNPRQPQQTAMHWLYQTMLAYSRPGQISGANDQSLLGCELGAENGPEAADSTPFGLYLKTLRWLEDTPPESSLIRIMDGTRAYLLLQSRLYQIAALAEMLDWAERSGAAFGVYGDFMINGDIDPVVIDIARCAATRILLGDTMVLRTIRDRSVAYKQVDRILAEQWRAASANGPPPRFFAAAAAVTRLMGVGASETVSAYNVDEQNQLIEAILNVDTRGDTCGEMAPGSMLPDTAGREVLRDINARLFDFVNTPVMRQLYANPGNYDIEGARTDLEGWTGPGDWEPNPGLLFDLQMVLREQVAIEELLMEQQLSAATIASLSNSQTVLRCSYSVGLLGAIFGAESVPGLVQSVNAALLALREEGVIADDQVGFENYWWRVGTGMAYMLALHDEQPDKLLPILRFLLTQERQSASVPTDLYVLADAVREAEAATGQISAQLDQALEWYLSDDLATHDLFSCPVTGVNLATRTLANVSTVANRAVGLVGWTGGETAELAPLAWVYELAPGGALRPTATAPQALDVDHGVFCGALENRFEKLSAAVQVPSVVLDLPLTNGVTLFGGSAGLRSELAQLEPFAAVATSPERPASLADVRVLLIRASREEAVYNANLALVARAAALPAGQWTILFPDVDRRDALTVLRTAMPIGISQSTAEDLGLTSQDLISAVTAQARQDRISATKDNLAEIADQLVIGLGAEVVRSAPITPLDAWASVGPMRYAETEIGVSAALGQQPNELPLLGGLLQIEVSDTGEIFGAGHPLEGLPQNEIAFTVRRALASDPSSSANATLDRLEASGNRGSVLPSTSPDYLPLGFSLSPVYVTPEGTIRFDGLEGLQKALEEQPNVTRQTMRELGLPDFMVIDGMNANVEVAEQGNIDRFDISLELAVAGTRLGLLELVLVENGNGVPIEQALEAAVKRLLADELTNALNSAGSFLETLRLPFSQRAYDAAQIRFGIVPNSDGDALFYDFDWSGETLTLSATYVLEIRDPATLAPEISIPAKAQLVASPSSFEVRTFQFDERAEAEIAKLPEWLLDQLGFSDRIDGLFNRSLAVVPVFDGHELKLHVAFDVRIDGCEITIDDVVPLDLEEIAAALGDRLEAIAQSAAMCTVDRTLAGNLDQIMDLEIDLFGISARIDPGDLGPVDLVEKLTNEGVIDLVVTVDAPWAQICGLTAGQRRLTGLRVNSQGDLSLNEMDQAERRKLGSVILCRIESVFDFDDTVLLTDPDIGRGGNGDTVVLIDVTVQNLPYLGTVSLGRVDFTSLDEETLNSGLDAVLAQLASRLAEDLSERFQGESLEMEGIGEVQLASENTFNFELRDNGFDIIARGELQVQDFTLPIDLKVSVPSGKLDVDVPDDAFETVVLGGLHDLISDYLPDLPLGGVVIDPAQFGPLDDRNLRYGLVIGVKANFDFAGFPLAFAMDRVTVSDRGVDLPQKVSLGIGVPIALPTPPVPIWLSKITMTLFTETADEPGLVARADLTVIEPNLAAIIKFAVELDLRRLDEARMSAEGNLILVKSVNLMRIFSAIDLTRGSFEFDGSTNSDFADILDAQIYGLMVIEEAFITTQSKLSVLGLDLSSNDLSICARSGPCRADVPPGIRIRSNADLLITQTAITADVDNAFKNPQVGGGITLRIFDWTVGSADLAVTLKEAELALSFLGIDLSISTPTIELLSPEYIASILASLFDISLEDLLNIDPENIRISVIGGGGDVSTVSDGDSDSSEGTDDGNGGTEGQANNTPQPNNQQEPDVAPPKPVEGENNIKDFGVVVDRYICIHYVGVDPGRGFREGIDGGRVELRGHSGAIPARNAWSFNNNGDIRPVTFPPDWAGLRLVWYVDGAATNAGRFDWMRSFPESSVLGTGARPSGDEYGIRPLCTFNGNTVGTVNGGQGLIGTARQAIDTTSVCTSWAAPFSRPEYRLRVLDTEENADFAVAGLPVFCLGGSEHSFIDTVFFLETNNTIRVMFDCPNAAFVSAQVRRDPIWQRACGPTARPLMIDISQRNEQVADPKGGVGFTAFSEINLIERFVRPYLLDRYEEDEEQTISFQLEDFQAEVTVTLSSEDADISIVVRTIDPATDEIEIRQVTIPFQLDDRDNPLHHAFLSTVGQYAFAKQILRIWLTDRVLPTVAYEALGTDNLLILNVGDRSGRSVDILRISGTDVITVRLTLPPAAPDGSIDRPLNRDDWEGLLRDIFLADLVGVPDGSSWQAIVGINESRDIHYYTLIGLPSADGSQDIRIRRDNFRGAVNTSQRLVDLRFDFSGDHDAEAIENRRFCYTDTDLIQELDGLLPGGTYESALRSLLIDYFMRPDLAFDELERRGALDDLDLRLERLAPC